MLQLSEKLVICAMEMGYSIDRERVNYIIVLDSAGNTITYHPHTNNDQALKLLKKSYLHVEPPPKDRIEEGWLVHCRPKGVTVCSIDLNLAIIDCVVACRGIDNGKSIDNYKI